MSNAPLKKQHNELNIDANVLQNRASNPAVSAWVGASAGSGKTKVLTDRILRLLLPDEKGVNACPPQKILALTFTKAGANEMSLRINESLSEWAISPLDGEKGLTEKLRDLLGYTPTDLQIDAARKLFASIVDLPGGLKIMTIHSFCQSILGRFPLEADLTPGFKPLEEEQADQLLNQAQKIVFKSASTDKASPLANAFHNLVMVQNEEQFSKLLKNIISERKQLRDILDKNFGTDGLYNALCTQLEIPAGADEDKVKFEACDKANFDEASLWAAAKALAGNGIEDSKKAECIQNWLEKDQKEKLKSFDDYKLSVLTGDDAVRSRLATDKSTKNNPDLIEILSIEAERLFEVVQRINTIKIINLTRDAFIMGEAILEKYKDLKAHTDALDFDDLILRTLDLLQGKTKTMEGLDVAPWVRYKLDQGIDHILVDEAQDTNPEQWEIIKAISDDFFHSMPDDIMRTLFVVGDQKQSIFSFQRARPEKFIEMKNWFEERIISAQRRFEDVNFQISFRSVESVLQLVDNIFSSPEMREGLDDKEINHTSYRYRQAGHIELWPLFKNPETEELDHWHIETGKNDTSSGASQMAAHIANTIKSWIDKKEILKSYDRPIQAGDIMILVKSRNAFIDQLVRALKLNDVPVSGVDRMVLSQQLVVQDLCAVANFTLLPEDDLNLATLLKSPFIGLNEEQLFDICYDREGSSVWTQLKNKGYDDVVTWLEKLIYLSGKVRPYEFFSSILNTACPAHSQSGLSALKQRLGNEILDPLSEFLNNAIAFEKDNIPTLQSFIQNQLYNETQIKRQMDEGDNNVRIMTVHGAKGLQAPIVILPDTVHYPSNTNDDRILWPDRTKAKLPYFKPPGTKLPAQVDEAKGKLKQSEDAEYRRLLYVALTRAEERLYIGGYEKKKNAPKTCWYNYIKDGFEQMEHLDTVNENNLEILRVQNGLLENIEPDRTGKNNKTKDEANIVAPDWLFTPIEEEAFPPRPLTPSRPSESDVPALSPLQADNEYRFLRGNITHKLLQTLPDMPQDSWKEAATRYVEQPAHDISKSVQQSILEETFKILNHSDFKAIFGPDSMAEVPVTGLIGNRLVFGQIDRLVVTEQEVLIIDYKTNRPPPTNQKNVPQIYRNQLKAYADVMRDIYKDKPVRAALLWTDGANLMELDNI